MNALRTLQVFVHPQCPYSKALLEDFRARGVSFARIDVSQEEGLRQLQSVCWEQRLPIVLDHERLSVGFQGRSSTFRELGIG